MPELTTNRDFYKFIADLLQRRAKTAVSLADYLDNLHRLARHACEREALSLPDFARLLDDAFDTTSPGADPRKQPVPDYLVWEERTTRQVRDLCEMAAAGTLQNEHRYLGVSAPSGASWYNFDPCTFLECATAGTSGGWEEGDDTGRARQVVVTDATGALVAVDPRDIEHAVVAMPDVTWAMFADFLDCGQWYE